MKNIQNIYDNPDFFTGYKNLRQTNQGFNAQIEQPAIYSLLPDLKGRHILDIGSGFGDFCRFAVAQGAASVLGVDPSANMIADAKSLTIEENIQYLQVPIETFEHKDAALDIIVSSVAFHYVEDFDAVIQKIARWLKPQGVLVFSVEHPICTAYPGAQIQTDSEGQLFHPVYNYRDEVAFEQNWFIEGVKKYHRTVSTYINTVINNQLTLVKVLEPMPSDTQIKEREKFSIHKIRPPLLVIKAMK